MAEILVRLIDGLEGHLEGDPVWVVDDGANWGWKESLSAWLAHGGRRGDWPGVFVVLKIPGEPVASLKFLLEADTFDYEVIHKVDGGFVRLKADIRARKHKIDINNIPADEGERTAMLQDGEITKSLATLNANRSLHERDQALADKRLAAIKQRDPTARKV